MGSSDREAPKPGAQDKVTCAEALEPVLEHQARCWNAAEENARRLSARVSYLLAALFGFLGLVLFRLESLKESLRANFWVMVVFGSAMILLVFATAFLFGLIGKNKTADDVAQSLGFSLRQQEILRSNAEQVLKDSLPSGQEPLKFSFMMVVHSRLLDGTTALDERNKSEKRRLDIAQVLIIVSVALIALAILGSMYTNADLEEVSPTAEKLVVIHQGEKQ